MVTQLVDDGNTGFLVQGNYFYEDYGGSLVNETGFDGDINDNMFVDNGWGATNSAGNPSSDGAIEINQSGAWNIPGSNYNNELLIQNNIMVDNWENITRSGTQAADHVRIRKNNRRRCVVQFFVLHRWPILNGDGQFTLYNYAQNNSNWGTLTNAASQKGIQHFM